MSTLTCEMRTSQLSGGGDMGFGFKRRSSALPAEVTSFVGRQEELACVDALLCRARLVSLVGPGGVGKTRLALRAAAAVKDSYPDGLCLAELTELREAELLPAGLAALLGLPDQSGREPLDLLVEHLRGLRKLLILDTCEHLVDACAAFADLVLREAPEVTLLVTSRQPLDVPGEHTFVVPPLAVEERDGSGARTDGSAVALFAQRAAAVVPGFRVTAANREEVVALCRRLDGIPLAIELATVRLRALSLTQLAARLEDRFRVLTGDRRTALPRHQTLRTTIGWSHELCSAEERLLWARLSVFAGAFDIGAAETVCAGGALRPEAVVEHLVALVDKSVVLRVDDEDLPRYRLLDTIREYGAEWLASTGEERACAERHLAWFRGAAEHFREHGTGPAQQRLSQDITRDLANFRLALEYAHGPGERPQEGPALAVALAPYWTFRSSFAESRHWLRRGLELLSGPCPERAEALCGLAHHTAVQGRTEAAMPYAQEAWEIAEALGDERLRGMATHFVGFVHLMSGEAETAGPFIARSRPLLEAAGDRYHLALNFMHEAVRSALLGRSEQSLRNERAFELALGDGPHGGGERAEGEHGLSEHGLSEQSGGERGEGESGGPGDEEREVFFRGFIRYFHGLALWNEGRRAECAAPLREAVRLKAAMEEPDGTAVCLETLAWQAAEAGRSVRAAWLLGAADAYWRQDLALMWGIESLIACHHEALDRVTSALGETRAHNLMRRGRALPAAEAVELAASDREHPKAPAPGVGARREGPSARGGGLGVLTGREREVAGLVAQGLTNREIAERLVISKRTADAHVEHILSKLGCSGRAEIAPLLERPTATAG
ncbi:LuxR C-terminal-related transcriptional regulator [Streptomyces sp. NBC_01795]|uniref:ATP-binding protein n=1 Tax=Streptomyces sp. NBC_01795 TaxID=2975943 RepID=UPI002DDA4F31|nr:LuxR C-terminal-related transcriptional regulator [Streptomyces sp. NBC_01795]WSA94302.1 LuxR C-terminal-related transcriptional regulator [Streptomyces sp. NBC_01795]